jgi:hypothetical protein
VSRTLAAVDTWPDLRVTVHLLPWTWKLRPSLYWDDVDGPKGMTAFRWLFLAVVWWGNDPLFHDNP